MHKLVKYLKVNENPKKKSKKYFIRMIYGSINIIPVAL